MVDKPTSWFWKGGKGHITADTIKQQLPPPSDQNLILVRSPGSAPAPPVIDSAPPANAGGAFRDDTTGGSGAHRLLSTMSAACRCAGPRL